MTEGTVALVKRQSVVDHAAPGAPQIGDELPVRRGWEIRKKADPQSRSGGLFATTLEVVEWSEESFVLHGQQFDCAALPSPLRRLQPDTVLADCGSTAVLLWVTSEQFRRISTKNAFWSSNL